jgi:hypothetical protein
MVHGRVMIMALLMTLATALSPAAVDAYSASIGSIVNVKTQDGVEHIGILRTVSEDILNVEVDGAVITVATEDLLSLVVQGTDRDTDAANDEASSRSNRIAALEVRARDRDLEAFWYGLSAGVSTAVFGVVTVGYLGFILPSDADVGQKVGAGAVLVAGAGLTTFGFVMSSMAAGDAAEARSDMARLRLPPVSVPDTDRE